MREIKTAYFVGDVHLDSRVPRRQAAFCAFLDSVCGKKPDTVFLMGDIFEFWYGYRTVMFSQTIQVVSRIAALVNAGIEVVYIVGNHDFNPGPVFTEYLNVSVAMEPLTLQIGPYRVYLSHGDEINLQDRGYRFVKAVLRNKVAQALFKAVPASWAWYLGRLTSDTSRKLTNLKPGIPPEEYAAFFTARKNEGVDVVIHGHTHRPEHRIVQTEAGSIEFINSGHWFGPGYFVRFQDSRFELLQYPI